MTKNDPVQLLINDGIATITLNDPTKLNALSIPLIDNFMSVTENYEKINLSVCYVLQEQAKRFQQALIYPV